MQLPYNSIIVLLGIYPREIKTKDLFTNVCSRMFIGNSPKLERAQTSFNGDWLHRALVHPGQEILLCNQKGRVADALTIGMNTGEECPVKNQPRGDMLCAPFTQHP